MSAQVLSFPQPRTVQSHFTGLISARIKRAVAAHEFGDEITIDNGQANGMHRVHQCRVRLAGDPTVYRMILAPADAPIELYGRPIGDAFAQPLEVE